jgi:hypothetical protein
MPCASAGAERREGGLRAGPAYVYQKKTKVGYQSLTHRL